MRACEKSLTMPPGGQLLSSRAITPRSIEGNISPGMSVFTRGRGATAATTIAVFATTRS
jgi:hypothetical protein